MLNLYCCQIADIVAEFEQSVYIVPEGVDQFEVCLFVTSFQSTNVVLTVRSESINAEGKCGVPYIK